VIARDLGLDPNMVSGRITELRKLGYLRPTGKLVRYPGCMKRCVEWEFVTNPQPEEVQVYDEDEKEVRDILEHFRKRTRAVNQNQAIRFYAWEVAMLIERVERRLKALGLRRRRGRLTQARATRV
jgi:hypothetical protein